MWYISLDDHVYTTAYTLGSVSEKKLCHICIVKNKLIYIIIIHEYEIYYFNKVQKTQCTYSQLLFESEKSMLISSLKI